MFQKLLHSDTCNKVKRGTKHGRPDQSQRELTVTLSVAIMISELFTINHASWSMILVFTRYHRFKYLLTTSVVGICRWQIYRKTDYVLYHTRQKYTPFSISSERTIASNIYHSVFHKYSRYSTLRFEIANIRLFFFDWNSAVCKCRQIKTSITYTWPRVIAMCILCQAWLTNAALY